MIWIFVKEFNSFLNSIVAYLVIGIFLTATGLLFWVFPESSVLDYGYAEMDSFFTTVPYLFVFLVPAITMRSISEEKKMGTLELLLTKPVSDLDVVMGKFLAALALVWLALAPTLVYYIALRQLGNPAGNIDTAAVVGSYVGTSLLAAAFCAIGLVGSALAVNQIVAFLVSAFLCFLFYAGFDSVIVW